MGPGAMMKLVEKVQQGENLFKGAQNLPLPIKMKIVEKVETDENKAIWKFVKRGPASNGGSATINLMAYFALLSAEEKARKAKEAFLSDPKLDLNALKCKLLGCNRSELYELEAYLRKNPVIRRQLILLYEGSSFVLRNVPPFSYMI